MLLSKGQHHLTCDPVFSPAFLEGIFAGSIAQFREYGIKFCFGLFFCGTLVIAILDVLTVLFKDWPVFSTFGVGFVYHGNGAPTVLDTREWVQIPWPITPIGHDADIR